MKKVKCILKGKLEYKSDPLHYFDSPLNVGDIYTVLDEFDQDGKHYYILVELVLHAGCNATLFEDVTAPALSEIILEEVEKYCALYKTNYSQYAPTR